MPGQYSFPITFKTFEGWPASFEYYTARKKGKICYHLVAAVEPENPMWEMKCGAEVILRETKVLTTPTKTCNAEVVSWYLLDYLAVALGKEEVLLMSILRRMGIFQERW